MRDKHGRRVQPGDVVKVFHFIGARRKKHYMYKTIVETQQGVLAACSSELGTKPFPHTCQLSALGDFEIVQGFNPDFDSKERLRNQNENA